ncbi:MAG: AAA family ATPase [Arcobacter sp.]|uniref:AAA family ATPase n=1 Tax=Arcobacter sp. TaxID=1872629 RepID=UPI003D049772
MQKLTLKGLKINISTNDGIFGQCLLFQKGLNVIRAENTSGKTTIISSIIYALGVEAVLSAKQGNTVLKSVLKEKIDFENKTYNVLESYVLLEIENEKKEIITIKRQIIGTQNSNLISVYFGSLITNEINQFKKKDFFLNQDGAAQRDRGFHKFLEKFMDIKLPFVPKYNDDKQIPLYIQTLIPLMFIEQVRGWSGIQATIPKIYGIEAVTNLTFEYLLNLDVMQNRLNRKEIKKELDKNKIEWNKISDYMESIAKEHNCYLESFPSITVELKKEDYPNFIFDSESKKVTSYQFLSLLREKLEECNLNTTLKIDSKELENKIDLLNKEIIILNGKLRENTIELMNEKNVLKKYEVQISELWKSIKNYKDIRTIVKLGSDEKINLAEHKCPTCKSILEDSLQKENFEPMDLETNIKFLESQVDAIDILIKSSNHRIIKLNQLENEIKQIIKEKRDLLSSFTKDANYSSVISEGTIREKISLENEIRKLEYLNGILESSIENLILITSLYKENKEKLEDLPQNDFSDKDIEKINKFGEQFLELLKSYGYSSIAKIHEIQITKNNYQPFLDGFDLTLESSASDNIRIIWAYSVALLYMTHWYKTNHFGFLIFDEPEQQRMKDTSSEQLYKTLSSVKISNMQSIIATSEDEKLLLEKIKNIKCNVLELSNKAIVPKNRWLYNNM